MQNCHNCLVTVKVIRYLAGFKEKYLNITQRSFVSIDAARLAKKHNFIKTHVYISGATFKIITKYLINLDILFLCCVNGVI